MARVRRRITNDKAVAIQVAGRWIQPVSSEVFDLEQLPPEWRNAGVEVPDTSVKKVPAMITEGRQALEIEIPSDGGVGKRLRGVDSIYAGTRRIQMPRRQSKLGAVLFGEYSGDQPGSALRNQILDAIASNGATVISNTFESDAFGPYVRLVVSGSASNSTGTVSFNNSYSGQVFTANTVSLAAEFPVTDVISVSAKLGAPGGFTVSCQQTVNVVADAATWQFHNGRMHIDFNDAGWTKTGYAGATADQNWRRWNFDFVIKQGKTVTIKIREVRAGTTAKRGRIAVGADDFYNSVQRGMAQVFNRVGIPVYHSIIPNNIENPTVGKTSVLNELKHFVDCGNECVVHFTALNTSNLFAPPYTSDAMRVAEACAVRDYIIKHSLGSDAAANCLVYAQSVWQDGSYNPTFLDALIAEGFILARAGTNSTPVNIRYMREDSHARLLIPSFGHTYVGAANVANDANETANINTIISRINAAADGGHDGTIMLHDFVEDGAANSGYQIERSRAYALRDAIAAKRDSGLLEPVLFSELAS